MPDLPGGWLPPQAPTRQPEQPSPASPEVKEGTNGLGVAATVAAVISLGLLVLTLGASCFLSLPIALTGWVLASKADPTVNPGQLKTGQVLAIIAVALSVVATVVWVILMLTGYFPDDLQRDLERELERQRQQS